MRVLEDRGTEGEKLSVHKKYIEVGEGFISMSSSGTAVTKTISVKL